jgi:hypothetical protein
MISHLPESLPVTVRCHPKRVSDVIGLAKANLNRVQLCGRQVDVVSDGGLAEEELRIDIFKGNIITDLHYSIHEV